MIYLFILVCVFVILVSNKLNRGTLNYNDIILLFFAVVLPICNGRNSAVIIVLGIMVAFSLLFTNGGVISIGARYKNVMVPLVIYLLVILGLLCFNSFDLLGDMERVAQFIIIMLVFVYSLTKKWSNHDFDILKSCARLLLTVSTVLYFTEGFPTPFYSIYSHFNTFGTMCFMFIVVLLLPYGTNDRRTKSNLLTSDYTPTKLDVLFVVDALILLFASSSRTSLVISLFYILITLVSKKFINGFAVGRRLYTIILVVTGAFISGFTVIYPTLYGTELGNQLEMLSRTYLHKNFFSGRQIIWANVLSSMEGKELFGYGLSMLPKYLYSTTYSSHNLYLQTYLQGGIVNLSALVLVLVTFAMCCINSRNTKCRPYFVGFIVAVCLHECFEIVLTQNQLGLSLFIWLILGFCIRESKSDDSYFELGDS